MSAVIDVIHPGSPLRDEIKLSLKAPEFKVNSIVDQALCLCVLFKGI